MNDADDALDRIANLVHGEPKPMITRAEYERLQAEVEDLKVWHTNYEKVRLRNMRLMGLLREARRGIEPTSDLARRIDTELEPELTKDNCSYCTDEPSCCNDFCEGLGCTRLPGHTGDHVACSDEEHSLRRWQNESGKDPQCHGEPGEDCPVHPMTEENQKPVYTGIDMAGPDSDRTVYPCPACNGTAYTREDKPCELCGNTGVLTENDPQSSDLKMQGNCLHKPAQEFIDSPEGRSQIKAFRKLTEKGS